MKRTLASESLADLWEPLARANAAFARRHPGDGPRRQPVQTLYGGAHLFARDVAPRMGELALRALDDHAPDPAAFAAALGLDVAPPLAARIYERVREKLRSEPVEDVRADFEDGYGNRPDEEEDGHAVSVAEEMAAGARDGTLPPSFGIRIKPLTDELRQRSARTLDLLVTTLVERSGGALPAGFVVNLAKVTVPEQMAAMAALLERLERSLGLAEGVLRFEMMVETPQAIVADDGGIALPRLLDAAGGRCVAAHFGTYDYTAASNITAAHQHMNHPACDFARQVMQLSFAGTGVTLSDGATNVLPVGPHRAAPGELLTPAQRAENRAVVHRAWRLQREHVHHSLVLGFYQGWDLHPAQLPSRYGTVYAFFLEALPAASARLRHFVEQAARATLAGDVMDDAATGQGLLNFFLRAIDCGAVTEAEALPLTGLTGQELRLGSFVKILQARSAR